MFKLPWFISRFSSWNFLLRHKFKFTTATFWHRKQESGAWAPGSTDCDSVECPRSCVEIAGNINYLYCQIPEMMPVVKPTQDTTPAPPHHSWAQPVNKDRNSSLPEIARGVSWCRDLGSAFIKYLPAKYSPQFRWVFSVMFPCVKL